jgi:hypothetical protein
MTWAQAIRDILVTLLIVAGVLGMFTNTLEILVRGWPKTERDESGDGESGDGE